ncbi:hypothetical protein IGI04_020467 [Brassica rapa subsp. trilocularis]|uniref:Uncharacterized protein n=1 Tax=Brassica rapa subsp. trilocularis TaxID=1813537 RepID=A0ABQ7MKF0_BRACM|nr:hypothetical protein IGI04_020467 [Brassica rapa subsp. trilocularis]
MTKMPLRNHKFEQKQNTERPQPVAPTSRSRLRERPRCVAARGRSGLVLASPGRSGLVLASPSDETASDFSLSLWLGRSSRVIRSTRWRRSGLAAPMPCSPNDHSKHSFLSSKCLQVSPRTPCGTPIPDKDSCMQNAT